MSQQFTPGPNPFQPEPVEPQPAAPKRRRWPWVVALVALVALVVVASVAVVAAVSWDPKAASFESPEQIANALADAGHEVALGPSPDQSYVTEVGGESYSGVIDSVQASVHVFPNEDAATAWLEVSKAFGGVAVAGDNWAISLDSDRPGREQSIEMAPRLADLLGGKVVQ